MDGALWCLLFAVDGRGEVSLWREGVVTQVRKPLGALMSATNLLVRENNKNLGLCSLDRPHSPTLIRNEVTDPARCLKRARQTSINRNAWLARWRSSQLI